MSWEIAPERPDHPDAVALITELDSQLEALYPPESRFGLPVAALRVRSIYFVVARRAGEPVGCGAFQRHTGYAELKRMFVRDDCRGQGLGRTLIDYLETVARAEGFRLLRLETGVHQSAAIRLYERAGFVHCPPFGQWESIACPDSRYLEKRL